MRDPGLVVGQTSGANGLEGEPLHGTCQQRSSYGRASFYEWLLPASMLPDGVLVGWLLSLWEVLQDQQVNLRGSFQIIVSTWGLRACEI